MTEPTPHPTDPRAATTVTSPRDDAHDLARALDAAQVETAVQVFEQLLREGKARQLDTATAQRLLAAAVDIYHQRREAGIDHGPFVDRSVSATAVLVASANMLQYAEIEPFEMGMWMLRAGA